MPEYLAPGTYVEEVRADVVPIQGVSTSTAGFTGLTERGPTQALLVTSWPQYQRWYGDVQPPEKSYLPLAVRGFFANGGQRVYVARVVRANAASSTVDLKGAAGTGTPPTPAATSFTLTALGEGTWGDRIWVQVSKATRNPDGFRLKVAYYQDKSPDSTNTGAGATLVEDYDELTADPTDSRFVRSVVNAASHLVTVSVPTGAPVPPAVPAPTTPPTPIPFQALTGGSEGDTGTVPAVRFVGDASLAPDELTGLAALAAIDDISILAVPDAVNTTLVDSGSRDTVVSAVIGQCEQLKDRFAILDIEQGQGSVITRNPNSLLPTRSNFAAIYYPHVRVLDPRSRGTILVPPSGFMAGIYANNDVTRGVHKAPANYEVRGILAKDLSPTEGPLEYVATKGDQDILNPVGINVIRDFRASGRGVRVWGARTISADPEWIYINVRRLFNYVEESIEQGLQWVVFEPNAEPTWARVRRTIETFLERVWRDGALMGTTREEAFSVQCDRSTMSADDILNGRLICLVSLAAVRPAEFVVLRFSQMTVEAVS
jgi:phage tail sheath protein FI